MWAFSDRDNVLFFLLLNMISDIYRRTGVFFQFIKTVLFEEGKPHCLPFPQPRECMSVKSPALSGIRPAS